MSVTVVLQALGWLSVVWLVSVHLLIQRGRLPQGGTAYRIAGSVAAASVIAAGVVEQIWPVAVLGLLWLRIEVLGHRLEPECLPEYAAPEQMPAERIPAERMPALLSGARPHVPHPPVPHPHLPHVSLPHVSLPHVPRPHLGRRMVDRVFKIEMAIVVIIALVLFGIWAEQRRVQFTGTSDRVVCHWIEGCR